MAILHLFAGASVVDDPRLAAFGRTFPVTPGEARIPVPLDAGTAANGDVSATVIRVRAHTACGSINVMERHPYSVQAFVPLGASRLVALVAPAGQPPASLNDVTAVHIPAGWGFAYHPGIWHAGMMGEGMDATALSLVRRLPDGSDTELADLGFFIDPVEQFHNV